MTTFTAERSSDDFPVFKASGSGILCRAFGIITIAINPVIADIYEMCRLPKGAIVTGGWFRAPDMDTGTESLDLNLGWADNGTESEDADGLGNFGIMTGDAIIGYKEESGTLLPLGGVLFDQGVQVFSAETLIQITCANPASVFVEGIVGVFVDYLNP